MLKSRFIGLFAIVLCLSAACETEPLYEDIERAQLETDIKLIETYLTANQLSAEKTSDGLYYQVESAGAGDVISQADTLKIQYKGYYLKDGVMPLLYDSTRSTDPLLATTLVLENAIEGWQKGIPLVRKGGKLRLILPSKLAYQNRQIGILPKNSIMDFDIRILDVIKPNKEENK